VPGQPGAPSAAPAAGQTAVEPFRQAAGRLSAKGALLTAWRQPPKLTALGRAHTISTIIPRHPAGASDTETDMAYKALNTGGLDQLNNRFRQQALIEKRERGTNVHDLEVERLKEIGADVKEQLGQDMRTVQAYVLAHVQLVDGRVQQAKQAIATAKNKVAAYKANPAQNGGTVNDIAGLINTVKGYKTEIEEDRLELDRAWSSYRTYVFLDVTQDYLGDFEKARDSVEEDLDDQKVKLKQIAAAWRQIEAFKAVADKIAMKANAQNNPNGMRTLEAARLASTDFSATMRKHRDRVIGSGDKKLSAGFVAASAKTLKANLTKQGFTAKASNLTASQALLKQAEQAYKTVDVNAKAAAKIFATTKKSFRVTELKDRAISGQVTYAQEYLDELTKAYKASAGDIASARKSLAALEKQFKEHGH
jgi:hypothetical protein